MSGIAEYISKVLGDSQAKAEERAARLEAAPPGSYTCSCGHGPYPDGTVRGGKCPHLEEFYCDWPLELVTPEIIERLREGGTKVVAVSHLHHERIERGEE